MGLWKILFQVVGGDGQGMSVFFVNNLIQRLSTDLSLLLSCPVQGAVHPVLSAQYQVVQARVYWKARLYFLFIAHTMFNWSCFIERAQMLTKRGHLPLKRS